MKRCSKCKETKELSEFYPSKRTKDGYDWYCKPCCAAASRKSQDKHREKNKAQQRESYRSGAKRRMIDRNRIWLVEHLRGAECETCHNTDPMVLEMDHFQGEKYRGVSYLVHNGYPLEVIVAEAAKCRILCANCHRRRTSEQFGWTRKQKKAAA